MAKRINIKKSDLIEILRATGFVTADKWSDERLITNAKALPDHVDLEDLEDFPKAQIARIKKLIPLLQEGRELVIAVEKKSETAETSKPKKKTSRKKAEPKPEPEETPKEETPKEETPKEETPKEETPKEETPKEETSGKPLGVIATIHKLLLTATKESPTTVEEIHAELMQRFPKRGSMETTLKNHLADCNLNKYGITATRIKHIYGEQNGI